MSDTKIINFLDFNSLNLLRWLLRYTKTAVQNVGGTPSYIFLKRTNEKNQFFSTDRLLNFLADFLTMSIIFQQPNLMLKAFFRLKNI